MLQRWTTRILKETKKTVQDLINNNYLKQLGGDRLALQGIPLLASIKERMMPCNNTTAQIS